MSDNFNGGLGESSEENKLGASYSSFESDGPDNDNLEEEETDSDIDTATHVSDSSENSEASGRVTEGPDNANLEEENNEPETEATNESDSSKNSEASELETEGPDNTNLEDIEDTSESIIDGESIEVDAGKPEHSSQITESGNCLDHAEIMAGHETSRNGQDVAVEALETDTDGHVSGNKENLETALKNIKSELEAGRRVVIGVNRIESSSTPNAQYGDNATNHFLSIYKAEFGNGQATLHFRDPGTAFPNSSEGTLTYNSNTQRMEGQSPYSTSSGNHYHYEMTTVRSNSVN